MDLQSITNETVLDELFRGMPPDERAVMCSLSGDPGIADGRAWSGIPYAPGTRCPLIKTSNNYVAISGFRKAEDDRWRRRKENFAGLYALMIDDVGTKVDASRLPSLPPSMAVETSPSNYQVSFFLDTPLREQDAAEDGIVQIIRMLTDEGIDPGMAGVTRVLRLPHGINGKAKYEKDGKPWVCRLAYWRPDLRSSWSELARAFGIVNRVKLSRSLPTDAVTAERVRSFGIVKQGLEYLRCVKRSGKSWLQIRCPWTAEHTDRADTGAAVSFPNPTNLYLGGYVCHHGHCQDKKFHDLESWVMDETIKEGERTRGAFSGVADHDSVLQRDRQIRGSVAAQPDCSRPHR